MDFRRKKPTHVVPLPGVGCITSPKQDEIFGRDGIITFYLWPGHHITGWKKATLDTEISFRKRGNKGRKTNYALKSFGFLLLLFAPRTPSNFSQ